VILIRVVVLGLKEREMLTLAAIASLGGCDPQVKAHVNGNKLVGNDKNTILAVITQCMPFIGFPKTFKCLGCRECGFAEN